MAALEPLLSIEEVSRLLRISESSVYRLVRGGELARVKVGNRTLFEPATVRSFIAGCRDRVPSDPETDEHGDEVVEAEPRA